MPYQLLPETAMTEMGLQVTPTWPVMGPTSAPSKARSVWTVSLWASSTLSQPTLPESIRLD